MTWLISWDTSVFSSDFVSVGLESISGRPGEDNTGSVSFVGFSIIKVAVDTIADGTEFVVLMVVAETTAVVKDALPWKPLTEEEVGLVKPLAIFCTLVTATSSEQPKSLNSSVSLTGFCSKSACLSRGLSGLSVDIVPADFDCTCVRALPLDVSDGGAFESVARSWYPGSPGCGTLG